jgi:branched-subunit amino acid aminotransferase/4-amino-4-deoxychorismate lyase
MIAYTLVDGVESPTIPATDSSVLRGDGCFESIRSYDGVLFALDWHLDRMDRSADMLGLEVPDRPLLEEWCRKAGAIGDGVVRVMLTRGDAVPGGSTKERCIVMHIGVGQRPDTMTLWLVMAPWHPAGRDYELAGAKTLSYAPNAAATRAAQQLGYDDALLVSDAGVLLEGPTFSVGWVVDGVVETPPLELHILDSITRRVVVEAARRVGVEVVERITESDRLDAADEVMVWSTVREVTPVVAVGERNFGSGGVAARLQAEFRALVTEGLGG